MQTTKTLCAIIFLASLASGCASTSGSHKLVTGPLNQSQSSQFTDLAIKVQAAANLPTDLLTPTETERMTKRIANNISKESPSRFNHINSSTPSPNTLQASVVVKRYDEGSAFARAMLAGLGQMHIDADVILADTSSNTPLAKYEVSKTFGWGGIYGAVTSIKDVEEGFCKAVADSILGKD